MSISEVLCLRLILKVLVIRLNNELFWQSFKVVTLVFEHSYDSKNFLVIDFIVSLRCIHYFGSICYWMPEAVVLLLLQESAFGSEVRNVYFNFDR